MSYATELKVGDGVTVRGWSDAFAYTVIAVKGNRATIQADDAELMNAVNSGAPDALQFSPGGFFGHTSGVQRWECKRNPNGTIRQISRRKDGRWRCAGEPMSAKPLLEGRHHHYDFNF